MVYFSRATLRFDGACQPNPGEGGGGYVIFNDKNSNDIIRGSYYIGWEYEGWNCTNNIAEYLGLIAALDRLSSSPHGIGHLTIEGDSEIVIKQMKGEYNVNSDQLRPLWHRARDAINYCLNDGTFSSYSFQHIYRQYNEDADGLAREAIRDGDWSWDYY